MAPPQDFQLHYQRIDNGAMTIGAECTGLTMVSG